jgi:hypothetical protein
VNKPKLLIYSEQAMEWRVILAFDADRQFEVEDAAASLARAAGGARMRIVDDDGFEVRDLTGGLFRPKAEA